MGILLPENQAVPMRILFLGLGVPAPLDNGGKLRTHHTLLALREDHEVVPAILCSPNDEGVLWELADQFSESPLLVRSAAVEGTGTAIPLPRPVWRLAGGAIQGPAIRQGSVLVGPLVAQPGPL